MHSRGGDLSCRLSLGSFLLWICFVFSPETRARPQDLLALQFARVDVQTVWFFEYSIAIILQATRMFDNDPTGRLVWYEIRNTKTTTTEPGRTPLKGGHWYGKWQQQSLANQLGCGWMTHWLKHLGVTYHCFRLHPKPNSIKIVNGWYIRCNKPTFWPTCILRTMLNKPFEWYNCTRDQVLYQVLCPRVPGTIVLVRLYPTGSTVCIQYCVKIYWEGQMILPRHYDACAL